MDWSSYIFCSEDTLLLHTAVNHQISSKFDFSGPTSDGHPYFDPPEQTRKLQAATKIKLLIRGPRKGKLLSEAIG